MGRFFIGLLVASLLFWAYDSFARERWQDHEAPADLPTLDGLQELSATGQSAVSDMAPRQDGAAAQPVDPSPAPPALTPIERIEADHSFLQSEGGRELARAALAIALSMQPGEALRESTRILEACMRSRIDKDDASARALVDEIYAKHRLLVRRSAFNPGNGERAHRYQVKPGDTLGRIAARYNKSHGLQLEGETLAIINRISNPRSLQAHQILRVPIDPISVVIEKNSFLCGVYLGRDLVKLYWCSHGRAEHATPVTSFVVSEKLVHPDWFYDGRQVPYGSKDNPLGTHFVKFRHESLSGFGIHGTTEPGRMMEEVSLGCIRLTNEDIADFFKLVPRGAAVHIRASL